MSEITRVGVDLAKSVTGNGLSGLARLGIEEAYAHWKEIDERINLDCNPIETFHC